MNGIINVYKEKGFTSFDVVAKLRGIFHQRKIGHTGTLDPNATGVLPVCVGNATKVCDLLQDKNKEYRAVMLLGVETDTQDMTGTVLKEAKVTVSEEQVKEVIHSFVGKQLQIPPMYSALKVNGKKLYDLAREGITVERKPREIEVYSISIEKLELPRVQMLISCSKGTYIRTICNDIGEKLGCGGAMEELTRTRVSSFTIEEAHTISEIEEFMRAGCIDDYLLSTDAVFENYEAYTVLDAFEKAVNNGNKLSREMMKDVVNPKANQNYRLYRENHKFIGIYTFLEEESSFKPVKLFFEE